MQWREKKWLNINYYKEKRQKGKVSHLHLPLFWRCGWQPGINILAARPPGEPRWFYSLLSLTACRGRKRGGAMKGEQTEEERMNNLQSVTKFLESIITLNREQHKNQSTNTRARSKMKIKAIRILGGLLLAVVAAVVLSTSEVKSWCC